MAAMVATKIGGFAMDDEPCAAAGAPGLPTAGRAEERKRKPAPIDEDERLFASFEPRRERASRGAPMPSSAVASLLGAKATAASRAGATARRGSFSQRYRAFCAWTSVSSDGVALPSTTGTLRCRARQTATSRP
jgi:hypothetical protein